MTHVTLPDEPLAPQPTTPTPEAAAHWSDFYAWLNATRDAENATRPDGCHTNDNPNHT
jgi:hypothetical protein